MGRHHHGHGRKRIASHSLLRRRSDAHVRRAEPWLRLRRTKQAGAMDGPDCVNPALTGMGRHHHEHGRKRIASHSNLPSILAGRGIAAIARIRRVGRREDGERGGPPPARQLMPPACRRRLETVTSVASVRGCPCPIAGRSLRASCPPLSRRCLHFAGHRSDAGGLVGLRWPPTPAPGAWAAPHGCIRTSAHHSPMSRP